MAWGQKRSQLRNSPRITVRKKVSFTLFAFKHYLKDRSEVLPFKKKFKKKKSAVLKHYSWLVCTTAPQ